jgi:hypothetical protein
MKKLVLETTAPFQGLLVAYDEGLFEKEGRCALACYFSALSSREQRGFERTPSEDRLSMLTHDIRGGSTEAGPMSIA